MATGPVLALVVETLVNSVSFPDFISDREAGVSGSIVRRGVLALWALLW